MTKYFCHDTNMHLNRKLAAIEALHGLAGYAIYCKMLEVLAASEPHTIVFDDVEYVLYAAEFHTDADTLRAVIADAVRLRLLQADGDTIYCEALNERLADYDAKAEQIREADELKREEISRIRSEAGKKGGNPNFVKGEPNPYYVISEIAKDNQNITKDNQDISKTEIGDNQNITKDNQDISKDNPKNKNKNIYNDDDDNPCVRTHERERAEVPEQLRRDVEQLATDAMWLDAIAMQNKLTAAQVKARLPDFVTSCIAQGRVTHDSGRDLKSHFANWLRIVLQAEKKQTNATVTPTTTNRSHNSPDAVARRMAEYEALDAYLASH